jgi:tetratricopeptide (TPR) repeat protein
VDSSGKEAFETDMADARVPMLDAIQNICDHLVERAATLFLGAGVNAGVKNTAGQLCPLAPELSEWICRDLLKSPETKVPLDESVEMARYALGPKAVNDYIYDALKTFAPGAAHLALTQLPWDVIYSTNFDLLVEKAAVSGIVKAYSEIRTVLTVATSLSLFSEADILYYKLHGSMDFANTPDGRLILTKSDYRFYEEYKRPLFRRLATDLLSRNFLFVGYSLSDANFRAILDDCREELSVQTFPLSYAVQHDFTAVQEAFWRDKYNIQLIKADATEFLVTLKDTWFAQDCKVVPFLNRKAVEYLNLDSTTRFQKVGDSFYLLRPNDCTGPSNPSAFFRGAEPSWADIREKVPPHRDAYESLLESVFPELVDPSVGPSALLVTGSAGTGKTALLRTFVYDVADGFGVPVFIHIPGTPLETRVLTPLINPEQPVRFVVLVDFAAEYIKELSLFWEEMRQSKLPITLLLEERRNQWLVAKASVSTRLNPTEFELGTLSGEEITSILDALQKYGCLGRLTGVPREEQIEHFTALAHQDLLVALRELTTVPSFDKIIQNEFEKIPTQIAKDAYLHVSAVGQLDLAVRYETLIRTLHLRYNQLGPELLTPTEGILMTGVETGASRHNLGYRLRARHPIIASIIFALAAPDDAKKFAVLNGLLSNLDPGFPEDLRLLQEITKRKELVNTFDEHAMRRALYDRIAAILPGSGHVFQHRSIIEREMRDADEAVRFARMAVKIDPKNGTFQNTLGLALEYAARDPDQDELKRQALLSEADKLFEDGIQRDRTDPYGYLGKLNIIRQKIERSKEKDEREELVVSSLSLLEDAHEATQESPIIAGELAKVNDQLGSLDNALAIVRRAAKKNPVDMRLKQLLIRFSIEKGDPQEALKVAVEAAKADPTSWRIQRSLARLRKTLGGPIQSVRGHYEAAIRHHKGDIGLVAELGAYLFTKGAYEDAKKVFETLRNLSLSGQERNKIRELFRGGDNKPIVFEGKVKRLAGASGTVVAIPDNFEAGFWRSTGTSLLREGNDVRFTVGFSSQGAVARNLHRVV